MTTEAEYQSVDLTEDERSSDDNVSYENSPLHFVDCTMAAMSPETGNTMSGTGLKVLPKVIRRNNLDLEGMPKTSIGKFLSVQIKPPVGLVPEMQFTPETSSRLDATVCLDSDEEQPNPVLPAPPNLSHPNNSPGNPQKHSGKVVVIKKNNKYYKIVIPHNVMPDISQSVGPVLINIPEVGPLVITTDPQVKKANAASNLVPQQLLNLDDIGLRENSGQVIKTSRRYEKSPREILLCDKKYCWTLITGRKRDLEGFAMNDRLGFNRAEANRTKKCWKTLESIVSNKKKELIRIMQNYNKFKDGVDIKKSIKFVKINEIVGKVSNGEKESVAGDVRGKPRHKKHKMAPHTQVCEQPSNEKDEPLPYSDLLLTKKVVILNKNGSIPETARFRRVSNKISKKEKAKRLKERIKKARAARSYSNKFNNKSEALLSSFDIKPCYVEMERDEHVEEVYRKYRKERFAAKLQLECRRKPVKKKVMANSSVKPRLKNCAPQLGRTNLPKQQRFFQNITKVFLGKVIRTEDHFEREMNLLKPILMVHEYNVRLIDYSEEFSKNNIVYIVRENCGFPIHVLVNEHFISAVELGYIKLVDSGLFCRFVSGGMELGVRKHDSDHSYCLNKK